jgi:hypothetical protein
MLVVLVVDDARVPPSVLDRAMAYSELVAHQEKTGGWLMMKDNIDDYGVVVSAGGVSERVRVHLEAAVGKEVSV